VAVRAPVPARGYAASGVPGVDVPPSAVSLLRPGYCTHVPGIARLFGWRGNPNPLGKKRGGGLVPGDIYPTTFSLVIPVYGTSTKHDPTSVSKRFPPPPQGALR